jgi:hypothetical protein
VEKAYNTLDNDGKGFAVDEMRFLIAKMKPPPSAKEMK